jgi:plasmid maintenance system antidote protein VapI
MEKTKNTKKQVVMDATGKGDFDVNGRGSELGTLDNSSANAAANKSTLRPGGAAGFTPAGSGSTPAVGGGSRGTSAPVDGSGVYEGLESLFSGQELSEDFKNKTQIIFEAAVNERISEIREQLITEASHLIEDEVKKTTDEMATRLDEYLDYVVEEWMKENQLSVESGIRTEVAESFMSGLKALFESHYIEVPEAKHDVLEDLFAENQKLEESLNEQIKNNVELNKNMTAVQARAVFLEAISDLTQVDAERLASLAENVEFTTLDEFKSKLYIIKENYLKVAPVAAQEPDTLTEQKETVNVDGPMSVYVNTLARQVKKL